MIVLYLNDQGPAVLEQARRGGTEIRGREWYDSIQGLRAVAMMLVFSNHLMYLMQGHSANRWLEAARQFGSVGTDLFLCVAGAFVYRNLVREEAGYWDFVGQRLRRVYPVYLVMLLLYLVLEALVATGGAVSGGLESLVKNMLLLPALFRETPIIDASWTLDYIVAFYFLSPLLYRPLRKLQPAWRPAALVGLWAAGLGVSLWTGLFGPRVTLLMAGPLVWSLRKIRIPWPVLLTFAAGGLWMRTAGPAAGHWRFAGSAALVTCIVLGTMGGLPIWQRLLSSKPLLALGYRSYSFYLCHGLPLLAFNRFVFPSLEVWGLVLASVCAWLGAVAFTEVVHKTVEVPWSLRRESGDKRSRGVGTGDGRWPEGVEGARA